MARPAFLATVAALAASTAARLRERVEAAVSDAARKAVLLFAALLFLLVALFSFSVAGFYALLPLVSPPWAACVVGGFWTLLALVCVLLASRKPTREESPPPVPPVAPELAAMEIARSLGADARRASPVLAILAFVAGFASGRK